MLTMMKVMMMMMMVEMIMLQMIHYNYSYYQHNQLIGRMGIIQEIIDASYDMS